MEQGLSLYQLHDDVEHPIRIPEVVDPNQVGMVEAGHRFGFRLKAGPELRIRPELARQNLDCDRAIEGDLPGSVDRSHSPLSDERSDLVGREVRLQLLDTGSMEFEIWGHGGNEHAIVPFIACMRKRGNPALGGR